MEHFTKLFTSLPRFHDKGTDSDSDQKSVEEKKLETTTHSEADEIRENRAAEQTVPEKATKSVVIEGKQSENKAGFDNMAFVKSHGDDEEEKAMDSIFKSFNNFTSKFKFTSEKIEEADKPQDITDGGPDEMPKKSEELSSLPTADSGSTGTEPNLSVAQRINETAENSNEDKQENNSTPNNSEQFPNVPEVKTVVTAPATSVPDMIPEKSPRAARRHTDNVLFFEGATLSPDLDLSRRRHSTDIVSEPRPLNEELIQEDLKKRGSPIRRRSTKKSPRIGINAQIRRESYSPRMERKQRMAPTNNDTRRKTLAELALESGYMAPADTKDLVDGVNITKQFEEDREQAIVASDDKSLTEVNISGELYLTLEYCGKTRTFTVHVHTANNLAAVDQKRNTSDPYVKTYLFPDKKSKKKTKTVRDDLNPEFDEIIKYNIGYDELLTRTLSVGVWNDDLFGRNDFLGEVVIHLGEFVEKGNSLEKSVAKWFNLTSKSEHSDLDSKPELILALKYVTGDKVKKKGKKSLPLKGELQLQVLEAKNLPGKDADGMSDPFCKISLLPDKKGKTKHKTGVIKRTLNPTWNYKFSYEELSTEDLEERVLEISVWDHDLASRDEFLGCLRLGLGTSSNEWDDSNEDETQIWHTMLNRTNVWIQVVIPLRPSLDSNN